MSRNDAHIEARSSPREGEHQMTSIQICRGCLSVDAISPASSSLAQAFTQVTGVQWDNERLPRALCVQCKALVTKCKMFCERVQRVNDVLIQMMKRNDLNLTYMKKTNPGIKPLLELMYYPPNYCDLYLDDTDDASIDKKIFMDQNKEHTQEIPSLITKQTTHNPLKSPKREFFDNIDYDGILSVEVDCSRVVDDEDDSEVADVVDSTAMVVDTPDIRHSGSSRDLCHDSNVSAETCNGVKPAAPYPQLYLNFEDLSKLREFFDSRSEGVDLDRNVSEDEENINIAQLKESTTIMGVNTVIENRDSSPKLCSTEGAPPLKRKLKITEERECDQKNKQTLKNHGKIVCTGTVPSTSAVTENQAADTFTAKRKASICDKCNIDFKSKEILIVHLSKCDVSVNCEKPLYRKTGQGTVVENPYACNICNYKNSNLYFMKTHVMFHTGEKPHVCSICNYRFSQPSGLKQHMRTHTGEKPYACNICDSKFSQTSALKQHMRTHTGEKPFTCNICDGKFAQSSALKQHMRTHTGEKPHVCNMCDSKFSHISHLKVHMRTHTGEKPHACSICARKFSQSSALKQHMKTHAG